MPDLFLDRDGVIVRNQSAIGRGLTTRAAVDAIHRRLADHAVPDLQAAADLIPRRYPPARAVVAGA
ncbi:MAG TPA: hypothetical protein VOB72_09445 [Candidatus Dormibacteraeota bacterium]|nr:hypothetical protein [Candidatus Dormibacteraeota bacterium]